MFFHLVRIICVEIEIYGLLIPYEFAAVTNIGVRDYPRGHNY